MLTASKSPGRLNWFQRHLNWTIVLAVLAAWGISFGVNLAIIFTGKAILPQALLGISYGINAGTILPVARWVLKRKKRELRNLWLLVVPLGWIGFLILKNESQPGQVV